MNVKNKSARVLCVCLAAILLICGFSSCAATSEVPDGYQYATCGGEYFRLFVPTQWTVNTESGISGAYSARNISVTMTEVAFVHDETKEAAPLEQYLEGHLAELAKMKDFKKEKTFDTTMSGYRAKDITYIATVAGQNLRFRQVLTRVEGRYYLFTYTAPADSFEAYLTIVDGILEEITFESFPFEAEDKRKIPDDVQPPEGMKLVSDNEVAYRFYVPESWHREPNVGQNFVYVSEDDRCNVSVLGYDSGNDATYTAETYWNECRDHYTATLENFMLISETETTMDGGAKASKTYEYTYTLGGVQYHVRQTICFVGMIYNMTYTATPEHFTTHLEDVVAMEQAFHYRSLGE